MEVSTQVHVWNMKSLCKRTLMHIGNIEKTVVSNKPEMKALYKARKLHDRTKQKYSWME